jgi:hypothetical protein
MMEKAENIQKLLERLLMLDAAQIILLKHEFLNFRTGTVLQLVKYFWHWKLPKRPSDMFFSVSRLYREISRLLSSLNVFVSLLFQW